MGARYGSLADDFYASVRLFLKLALPLERNTVLHFFEQVRKAFPTMQRLHRREDGCLVLDEPSQGRSRRWIRLDASSLRFGHFAPPPGEGIRPLGDLILEQAPYHLTLSPLDLDHLEVIYGFDLEYRGNHDQLLAETLWSNHPLSAFLLSDKGNSVIDAQPYLGVALTPNCDLQAYIDVKSRTGTYEVRTGEFESQPLSAYLTIRKYWGLGDSPTLTDAFREMTDKADDMVSDTLVPLVVNPLAQAIASRP